MSLKKLLLGTAAFALVAAVQMQSAASANDCIDVIVYITDPATGICYPGSPCAVPPGWTVSTQPCAESS